MLDLKDKKVTILGAQRTGMALARLLVRLKARAKISEQGPEEKLNEEFKAWASQHPVAFEFNGHTQKFIEDSDVVVLSPGVRFDGPPVQWAKAKGIPIFGEIEWAYQFCTKPVIGVTGSNGKTTVTTLIYEILKKAGYRARLCGNIGLPFAEFVLDLHDEDFVVLELSSFQLESILDPEARRRAAQRLKTSSVKGFKPYIAVLLNFTQNHLDRHADLEEYFLAKSRIFLNQDKTDHAVLSFQQQRLKKLAHQLKAHVSWFDDPAALQSQEKENPNYLAAMAVARILKIDPELCADVFKGFKGVEHRLEWVRSLHGVYFVNDSKATTTQATLWALQHIDQPVVMICGGRDKHMDFSVLEGLVKQRVKKMFVIGEAKEKLRRTFEKVVGVEECQSLENAVFRARETAAQGDCVLLSPMCASFDMFADFEERGRKFKEIVNKLT